MSKFIDSSVGVIKYIASRLNGFLFKCKFSTALIPYSKSLNITYSIVL